MDAAIDAPQSRYYHSQGARLRRRYSLGPSSTRPRTLGYPWARALPPSSRYADARCAGQWAWSRRFRKAVAIQPLNALTGHGCIFIATGREGGAVRKTIAVLGSALFFAVAPSSVAGLVPCGLRIGSFGRPSS